MRVEYIGVFCLVLLSCRDIQPVESDTIISGYQLNGVVTTANGVPVEDVEVRLYYNYTLVRTTPIDSVPVVVTDSTDIVDIAVYTQRYEFVRQLFLSYLPVGLVPRARWDGRDTSGTPVPSGKYLIRYVVDTVIVKYSPVLISRNHTSTTDSFGRFIIPTDRFPIGELFDFYDSQNSYTGTYTVNPHIGLEFRKLNFRTSYSIELLKDQITSIVFTL